MLGHYLLTLYRSLSRHRLYAAINVLGLAVGIAVFLVLFLEVRFETSFERWIPGASQVYMVETNTHHQGFETGGSGALLDQLHTDYPDIVGTRVRYDDAVVRQPGRVMAEQVKEVDPSFFQVIDPPLIAGDRASLLKAPDEVVLTQSKAKAYFGDAQAIGQKLDIQFDGRDSVYRVVGVIKDLPHTSDFNFDVLVPVHIPTPQENRNWRRLTWANVSTFLRLPTPRAAQALNKDFDRFADRHGGAESPGPPHTWVSLKIVPMVSLHLRDPRDVATVAAFAAVGALTLLLAAVNYINLATARAGLRAREVALRKVMGATQPALIVQFLGEALATAALGALFGLALCEIALPAVNATGGMFLRLDYTHDGGMWATIFGVVALVGVGGGIYPALVLSRFQPASVLASARSPGGGRMASRVREGLVAFQFAVAITFTITTAVMVSQASLIHHADLGFRRQGLIVLPAFANDGLTEVQRNSLLAAWRALPGVQSVTQATTRPGFAFTAFNNISRVGATGQGPILHETIIGPDFFATYGAKLLAGRAPDLAHGGDYGTVATLPSKAGSKTPDAQPPLSVVLNTRAVSALGFRDAADAISRPLIIHASIGSLSATVIGVVGDVRFASPRERMAPMAYVAVRYQIDRPQAAVRFSGANPKAVIDEMAADWRRIAPDQPFEANTSDQALAPFYLEYDYNGHLFTIGAALAVLIGCVGLYGLASFNTARRVKEIGIRKTLGASTTDLLKLLIGQFLRPVILSNLFAWPLAWWAMNGYLSGFDQRIALTPVYFLAATALTLLIAVATVGGQAYAVARAEPAKALRHE